MSSQKRKRLTLEMKVSILEEVESGITRARQPTVYDETSLPPELIDIPLPASSSSSEPKPQKPKFKEKTVTSLGCSQSGPVAFKKRKIGAGARNVRQKDNDD